MKRYHFFIIMLIFSISSHSQKTESKDTSTNAPLNYYNLTTESLVDIKRINWSSVKKYFSGNKPDDVITIDIVYSKEPGFNKNDKMTNQYAFSSKGLTKNLNKIIDRSKEFCEFLLKLKKE